ncbi:MAG: class I SAM-dependent methyltransferase [Bacteroidetes bacterium]|nr:class I SAM-dependent methyltransferase [Bacteroidota bacterium]
MKRELTNKIRWLMDELLPPALRDAYWFMYPFFFILYRGKNVRRRMHFKTLVRTMSPEQADAFYEEVDIVSRHRLTDLAESNIQYILKSLPAGAVTIADIGCGKGYLLHRIQNHRKDVSLTGVDVENRLGYDQVAFTKGSVTRLPFADNHFDVVICTHTIEHILPLEQAMQELLRITKKRLIIVTPCQRAFYYTFDGHVNFFRHRWELLRHLPLEKHECLRLDMDWIYIGDK